MLRSITRVRGFKNTSTLLKYSTQKFPSVTEPSVTLYDVDRNKISTGDLFSKGRHVVIGVPGAFTPICSSKRIPDFLENGKNIKAKYGVDKIIVVSVNDAFVMAEWKNKIAKESNEVEFLADPAGQFAVNTGLDVDLTAAGLGKRCKRFSAIVDNGKVVALNVEDSPGDFKITGSERITEQLQKLK